MKASFVAYIDESGDEGFVFNADGSGSSPHLKKSLYRHKGTALGYGVKIWPEDLTALKYKVPEAINLEDL